MGNEKQALVKKQVVFVKSDCSCPRALPLRQDSPRIGCIRWANRVYCNPIFICGGRGAHVRFVSGRSLAGAERRYGSGADGDVPGADFCRQYAALGGQAALLAQLGADPFGRKLAARLARDGVDCSLLCFTDAFPTPVVFTGEDTALPYRAHTAGLALGPEQLEAAPFRGASAFCFSSTGLVDSPLRLAHLKALAAARDAGALCCYLPRLAQAAPYWPQREALCQTALQFLDRADVLFLEESDLLLLFGSRELRTALFALFTGHVQLIFFYKKDRILAFTRSVMASAAKKDQSPALVLYRMEKIGIHVIDLPRLREHVLGQLLSNDANTTECQGLPY